MRKLTSIAKLVKRTESSILCGGTWKIGSPKTTSARGSYAATVGFAETTGQISEQTAGAQAPRSQLGIHNNNNNMNIARASEGAKNMHQLSWGGQ